MSQRAVPHRRHRYLAGVILATFALVSCGSDSDGADGSPVTTATPADASPADTVAPNGETVDVIAIDNTFRPDTTEITAGTEIHWENKGHNDHNVLPADDAQTWGVDVGDFKPGDEYAFVFSTPGTYHYYCSLHGTKDAGMIGTIVVTPG